VESELFRRSYSREPRAKFIGVWDTVGALGLPVGGLLQFINKRWSFNDMTLSSWVDNAFQALAIDERRKPFRPSIWEKSPNADGQVLEQIWFADVHSNVGGSYPRAGLSDITLLWMIGKGEACGLAIDRSCVSTVDNPKPDHSERSTIHKRSGTKSRASATTSILSGRKTRNLSLIRLSIAWATRALDTNRQTFRIFLPEKETWLGLSRHKYPEGSTGY